MSKNINKFNFRSVYSGFNVKKAISHIETEFEFTYIFPHLAGIEVQKYLPSYPYWAGGKAKE